MMTDDRSLLYYLFWANLGLSMFNASVSEKELDTAKESAEKLQELHIDRLSLSKDEKERIKRERKAENEEMMRGLKDTLKRAGKLI